MLWGVEFWLLLNTGVLNGIHVAVLQEIIGVLKTSFSEHLDIFFQEHFVIKCDCFNQPKMHFL